MLMEEAFDDHMAKFEEDLEEMVRCKFVESLPSVWKNFHAVGEAASISGDEGVAALGKHTKESWGAVVAIVLF